MEKSNLRVKELKEMAKLLVTDVEQFSATMVQAGSRMTSTFTVLHTGAFVLVDISNCVGFKFNNEEEFEKWLNKKEVVRYSSDKEMYQDFTGMDDETWEEWNK
mgnify:CR=1 FL=1